MVVPFPSCGNTGTQTRRSQLITPIMGSTSGVRVAFAPRPGYIERLVRSSHGNAIAA